MVSLLGNGIVINGLQLHVGTFQQPPEANEMLGVRVIQQCCTRFLSTRHVIPKAAGPEACLANQRKRRLTPNDERVLECKRRVRDGTSSWKDASADVVAFLEEWHPEYYHTAPCKSFLKDLRGSLGRACHA